jgi:hypothetical protein
MAYTGAVFASIPLCKTAPVKGVTYVWGKCSDGRVDRDRQIVDESFSLDAIRRWLGSGGPVRMGHDPTRPVGKGVEVDGHFVKSMIVDKQARKMLRLGVLTAYSVGIMGPVIKADAQAPGGRIVGGEIVELSIVDSPSNVGAGITVLKARADGTPEFVGKSFLVKGKKHGKHAPVIVCTACGHELDAGEKFCTQCGQANAHYTALADRKLPMNQKGAKMRKKTRKRMRALVKAQHLDLLCKTAGRPVRSESAAVRAWIEQDLTSPDPARREAARAALARP